LSAIPKPLLILAIVMLVLGVASCGMGLLGGGRCESGDTGCQSKQNSEMSSGGISRFLKGLAPAPAKVELGPADADCFLSGHTDELVFGGPCEVRVPATKDTSRRLRLTVASGTIISVEFITDRQGEHFDKTQTVPFSDDQGSHSAIELTVGRDESPKLKLGCFSGCTVTLD
jgi:hypothetical protein